MEPIVAAELTSGKGSVSGQFATLAWEARIGTMRW